MADDAESRDEGLLEARTGAAPGENPAGPTPGAAAPAESGGALPTRAEIAASVAGLAAALGGDPVEQLDLLSGSPDLDDADPLARAADHVAAPRRGRGRPQGAANKRNDAVFDYLAALGHRDPAVTLSLIQTADTAKLAEALGRPCTDSDGDILLTPILDRSGVPMRDDAGELLMRPVITPADPVKILAIQEKAASRLMDFKYARKPQQLDVRKQEMHVFLAGSLGSEHRPADGTLFGGKIVENQPLGDGASVRHQDGESHDTGQAIESAGKTGDAPHD